ncbi:hypothetical protein K439DRAFT_1303095, partial [Ramaria rubella]
TCMCLQCSCENFHATKETLTLCQPSQYVVTLFTKGEGALPVFSHSIYCGSTCCLLDHPSFSVNKEGSMCAYYEGVPDVNQVAQWSYFEMVLLELQANQMCFA